MRPVNFVKNANLTLLLKKVLVYRTVSFLNSWRLSRNRTYIRMIWARTAEFARVWAFEPSIITPYSSLILWIVVPHSYIQLFNRIQDDGWWLTYPKTVPVWRNFSRMSNFTLYTTHRNTITKLSDWYNFISSLLLDTFAKRRSSPFSFPHWRLSMSSMRVSSKWE